MQKKLLLRQSFLLAALSGVLCSNAQSVTSNGLTFDVLSGTSECKLSKVSSDLITLDVPAQVEINGTQYSVTEIGSNAVQNCSAIESVSFPTTIRTIGRNAFEGCSGLTEITFNEGITTLKSYSFNNCSSLKSVIIPSSLVKFETSVFYGCDALEEVNISDLTSWCAIDFNDASSNPTTFAKHLYINGVEVTELNIPEGVEELKPYVFSYLTEVVGVTVPASMKTIGDNAFYGCTNIASVNTPDLGAWCEINFGKSTSNPVSQCKVLMINGETLSEVVMPDGATTVKQYVFYNCTSIAKIVLPSTLTSIQAYAFYNCTGLENIEFPETLTSFGSAAFAGCTGLKSVELPSGVTSLPNNMFQNCKSLQHVGLPSGLTSIGNTSFFTCSALTDIQFPATLQTIGQKAFQNCSALATINFEGAPKTIGDYAFQGCSSLSSVNLPEGLTELGFNIFFGCSSLEEITLPSSLTALGNNVFANCTSLASITCKNVTPPAAKANSFSAATYLSAKLIVPDGTKDTYAETDVWKDFSNILEASLSGIADVELNDVDANSVIYSINGQVMTNTEKLTPGIYLVKKGKNVSKIIVR